LGATNRSEQDTPVGKSRARIEQNAAAALARAAGSRAERSIGAETRPFSSEFMAAGSALED
jgi:hypothetical protein